jgi:hypothetical protein
LREAGAVGVVDEVVPCSEAVAGYAEGRENGELRKEVADGWVEKWVSGGCPEDEVCG